MNELELEPSILPPYYSESPWGLSVNNFRTGCFLLTFPLGFPHSIAEAVCTR